MPFAIVASGKKPAQKRATAENQDGPGKHPPTAQACNSSVNFRCATHYSCTTGIAPPLAAIVPSVVSAHRNGSSA